MSRIKKIHNKKLNIFLGVMGVLFVTASYNIHIFPTMNPNYYKERKKSLQGTIDYSFAKSE